jgi:hypothetical protein
MGDVCLPKLNNEHFDLVNQPDRQEIKYAGMDNFNVRADGNFWFNLHRT